MRFIVGALFAVGVGVASARQSPRKPAGECFALAVGTWNRPVERWQHVPAVVQLDTAKAVEEGRRSEVRMVLRPSLYEGPRIRSAWSRLSGDSIQMSWSNGF